MPGFFQTQLVEDAKQLPVIIIRPSIVGAMWKDPLPGWTDNINGPTGIFAAVGKGVLTNMCGSGSSKADIIPVDVVANMIIVAAAHRATNMYETIPVMHCASGDLNPLKWEKVVNFLEQFYHEYPMEQCFAIPSTRFHTSRKMFEFNYYIKHHIPASTLDFLNGLMGRKKKFKCSVVWEGLAHGRSTSLLHNSWLDISVEKSSKTLEYFESRGPAGNRRGNRYSLLPII
ncbi:unnamed protein product [Heligmosomoides polygyrus]|uniref:Fatty acyl-CoA reductase n=1 Tax=Heligmosomoides polygyrus TaxID=6339 RepID=A0A183G410_HELPZ|nr:unnamed protein product [Heligmosomoides polygyrus]